MLESEKGRRPDRVEIMLDIVVGWSRETGGEAVFVVRV